MICVAAVEQPRLCHAFVSASAIQCLRSSVCDPARRGVHKKRAPVFRELFLYTFPTTGAGLKILHNPANKFVHSSDSPYRSREATEVQRGEEENKLIWS